MIIKEYQVKKLFRKHGVPVPKGDVAYTPEEAYAIAEKIGGNAWVVKAQVSAADRANGFFTNRKPNGSSDFETLLKESHQCTTDRLSGIGWANSPQMVSGLAEQMLGRFLITPESKVAHEVQRVYVEGAYFGQGEYKLSLRIDFTSQQLVLTVYHEGESPRQYDLIGYKLTRTKMRQIIRDLKLKEARADKMMSLLTSLMTLFETYEAIAVEFDPILDTADGFIVLNGRIVFNEDALFRFPEVESWREIEPGQERQASARRHQFRYTRFGGNIACLVNGIGLGQATVDLIHSAGGRVACLLDIGTEPSQDVVSRALKLALADPDIDGVLVNIFGGITRCEIIAQGLISAAHEVLAGLPVVVRMDGTNAHIGRRLLFESRLPFSVVQKMDEAVREIINQVKGAA